jgi:hypothetical protein
MDAEERIQMMKAPFLVAVALLASALPLLANPLVTDPARIDAYVTPYYNSVGPAVKVGKFSTGLASKSDKEFVATILSMKRRWNELSFCQMYVGAIRLYDLGYRKEAVYWFYSAQYRGRQFALLVDRNKMGGMGDAGFELFHAQDAFLELVGPYINGYAFGDPDSLTKTIRRVQSENRSVGDLRAIYPGVAFTNDATWKAQNEQLNQGLDKLVSMLANQKDQIKQQRVQNGTEAQFSHLASKPLPGGI